MKNYTISRCRDISVEISIVVTHCSSHIHFGIFCNVNQTVGMKSQAPQNIVLGVLEEPDQMNKGFFLLHVGTMIVLMLQYVDLPLTNIR